jgi:hypothetical protein
MASTAYCEQLGWYLQRAGSAGEMKLATDRDAQARVAVLLAAREGVHHQVPARVRAALAVDTLELAATREPAALAALAVGHARYGLSRLRPLLRRRLRMCRPARVRIRARKPWVRARLRFLGW